MSVIACPHCHARLTVTDELAEEGEVQCPRCRKLVPLDPPEQALPARPSGRSRRAKPEAAPDDTGGNKAVRASGCASIGGCLLIVLVCGGAFSCWSAYKQRALDDLAAADRLYAEGKKAEAVGKYKDRFSHVPNDRRQEIIQRVVDHEATGGDKAEARRWVEKGLDGKMNIAYESPAARDLLAQVQRERAEAEAKKQEAEAKKKAEREAKVQAAKQAEKEAEETLVRYGSSVEAYRFTQSIVKARLQPYDAKFSLVPDFKRNADGSWTTLGAVTTPNEFGGKNKYLYKSTVKKLSDGQWEDIETKLGIDPG